MNTTGILQQTYALCQQTPQTQMHDLIKALAEKSLDGTLQWHSSVTNSIRNAIDDIDELISMQLAEIIHNQAIRQLEGRWRGLHYLIKQSPSSSQLKFKVMHLTKSELTADLSRAIDFDQSELYKKIYEAEFGTPGGEPYGALVGDYEFSHHPQDTECLRNLSGIAASAFCPFLSSASARIMGFNDWSELTQPRDLNKIFESADYIKWNQLRQNEDSRFIALTMPRVLARLPYGRETLAISAFNFEEAKINEKMPHHHYCWMNSAYVLAERMTHAFAHYGFCTAIRGAEGGGKITNLPLHAFCSDNGDIDIQCPSEVGITDRREAELSQLGFLPLCHYKNTDYAVFFGAESIQQPRRYDTLEATANARISARLPYLMAVSRFAHYLKVMARDKIGSFLETDEVEAWLNRWILKYVNSNASSKQTLKAKYPLAQATIKVVSVPGKPGAYQAVAWLKPWLQMEELTTSLRLVAQIPKLGSS